MSCRHDMTLNRQHRSSEGSHCTNINNYWSLNLISERNPSLSLLLRHSRPCAAVRAISTRVADLRLSVTWLILFLWQSPRFEARESTAGWEDKHPCRWFWNGLVTGRRINAGDQLRVRIWNDRLWRKDDIYYRRELWSIYWFVQPFPLYPFFSYISRLVSS